MADPKVIHAPAGLGFTYCGKRISQRVKTSGDERETTCPRCREEQKKE